MHLASAMCCGFPIRCDLDNFTVSPYCDSGHEFMRIIAMK